MLRLDYQLDESSTVFDVGGYHGDFAAEIHKRYGCTIYIFEPSKTCFDYCSERFKGNEKIIPLPYGLSDKDEKLRLSDDDNGASVFRDQEDGGELIELRAIHQEIKRVGIGHIDLLKLNIEGSEFPLLRSMLDLDLIPMVRFLQVQFHDFYPDARNLRDQIRQELSNTHLEQWCFPFVWESWQRRKD